MLGFANHHIIYSLSGAYSKISPGWQLSSRQIASNVEKRTAFALPVFRIDRLAGVMLMRSANSPSVILRLAITFARFTTTPILIRFYCRYVSVWLHGFANGTISPIQIYKYLLKKCALLAELSFCDVVFRFFNV